MNRNSGIWWKTLAAAAVGILAAAPVAAQKTELNVYTALETDQIKAYEEAFKKANPNIDLKWVRDSTGVITAKLLAEKANPQADLVDGHVGVEPRGARTTRACCSRTRRRASTRSRRSTATRRIRRSGSAWTSAARRSASTRSRRRSMGLPKPETWKDLTKPIYKGKIVMPNPASSGTGYLDVIGAGCRCGARPTAGSTWTRCTRTSRSTRTRAASRAGRRARASSRSASRSSTARSRRRRRGRADRHHLPDRGPGLGPRGVRHHEEHEEGRGGREALMDWARDARRDGALRQELRDRRDAGHREAAADYVPADYEKRLVKNDFAWSAKNRDRILAEWTKRYDGKSEPK